MSMSRAARVAVLIAFVILFAFAVLGERQINANARKAYVTSCNRANEVRVGIRQFIDGTIIRSERFNEATVASKTASHDQKQAAQATLDALGTVHRQARAAFAAKDCTYPPK